MKVILKDGSQMEVEKGISVLDLAKKISEGLARMATCAKVNGEVKDLRYNIEEENAEVEICTFDNSEEGKKSILAYNISHYGTSYKKNLWKRY